MKKDIKLFFIHGAGGTASKWRKVQDILDKKQIPYNISDLPGHGSDERDVPNSIAKYANCLNREIQEDVIVVGHSMGGLIGIELAARNEKVKGLVLVNSHYHLAVNDEVLKVLMSPVFPEKFFRASYAKGISEELLKEERAEWNLNSPTTILTDFLSCDMYHDGGILIKEIKKPFFSIYGTEDRLIPRTAKEKLAQKVPHLESEIIDGAGHYSIIEKSEEVVKVVLKFKKNMENEIKV